MYLMDYGYQVRPNASCVSLPLSLKYSLPIISMVATLLNVSESQVLLSYIFILWCSRRACSILILME